MAPTDSTIGLKHMMEENIHMIGIIAKLGRWEATEKMRANKTRS